MFDKNYMRRFKLDRLRSLRSFVINELVWVQEQIAEEERQIQAEAESEREQRKQKQN